MLKENEGEWIRVTLADGRRLEITDARIENDSLVGQRRVPPGVPVQPSSEPGRVAVGIEEVTAVEVRERMERMTGLLVSGLVATVLAVILLFRPGP